MAFNAEMICKAAGWVYCTEHDRPMFNGSRPCAGRHVEPTVHAYYCGHGLDTEECICGAAPTTVGGGTEQ